MRRREPLAVGKVVAVAVNRVLSLRYTCVYLFLHDTYMHETEKLMVVDVLELLSSCMVQ